MDSLEITGHVFWNKDFLHKQRRMKKEAQERLMGDVGGKGKYNATPPSDYCPSVKSAMTSL